MLATIVRADTTLAGKQVLGHHRGLDTVTLTLSGHAVALSSLDLGQSLRLRSQRAIVETIVKPVGLQERRLLLINARLQHCTLLLVTLQDVHPR